MSFISAGNQAVNSAVKIRQALANNKPDYTGIGTQAIKDKTKEDLAQMDAKAKAYKSGLTSKMYSRKDQIARDTDKYVANKKKQTQMAGKLAGGVALLGTAGFMSKEKVEENPFQSKYQSYIDENNNEMRGLQSEINDLTTELDGYNTSVSEEDNKSGDGATATGQGTKAGAGSATQSLPTAKPKGVVKAPKNRAAAFNEIYSLAKQAGGTKFPEVVAAQAMHETGWMDPKIKSVYNSSGGTNPFGQTGDRGYGTIPREGFSDGWTIYPDKKTAVADHISLWHDTKNHKGNYNAFNSIREGVASVAPAYSPNSDPENIRRGYTVDGYAHGVKNALEEMGYSF